MPNKILVGSRGEELAIHFLKKQGYRILDRNYRARIGEIDIVAQDKDTLCFIEVKARRAIEQGTPFEAVTFFKQRKLIRLAQWYLKDKRKEDVRVRFDVVGIVFKDQTPPEIELVKNAFTC